MKQNFVLVLLELCTQTAYGPKYANEPDTIRKHFQNILRLVSAVLFQMCRRLGKMFCFGFIFSCADSSISLDQQTNTGWAKKTGPFLNVDNFAMVSGRKACDMSKVCKFCLEKSTKLA